MSFKLLDLYDVKSGMGNKSRDDFNTDDDTYKILMFKDIFYNFSVPRKIQTNVLLKSGELERFDINRGDVFLTSSSETANELAMSCVALSDYPNTVFSGFAKRLRPKTSLTYPEFMKYWFRSREFRNEINASVSMVTRANLNMSILEKIAVTLPSFEIQKRIAKILAVIDQKIEINKEMNQTLEQMAQAIFKQWFVDFEFPNENGEPYKSSGGEMVESELGEIPVGWVPNTLGDLAVVTSGKRPKFKEAYQKSIFEVPVIGASSVMAYTNELLYGEKIIVTGRVGTHGVIQRFDIPCWPSDNTLVLISDSYEFVYQVLKTIDFKSMNRGSTQPLITQTDIKNVSIIKPNDEILVEFEKISSEFFSRIYSNENQNSRLIEIRDSLLPKLMSGEIDVSQVEI